MTDTDMKAREASVLADFRDYIHANYGPGCVLSDPQWHAPKLFRAAVGSYLAAMPAPLAPTINALTKAEDIAHLQCLIEQAEARILDPEDSSDPHLQDAAFYSRLRAVYREASDA